MAGDPVILSDLAKGGDLFLTDLDADGASWMEVASRWKGDRARRFSSQNDPFTCGLHDRVRNGHSRKQSHGIGMFGEAVECISICNLSNLSQIHDCDSVADMPDH
jgi:hypothetical protein